jgi:hypothetical protein
VLLYIESTSPIYAYSHLYKPFAVAEVERLDNSPFRYFLGELYGGNSLRSTIAVGNEKKRQRVYNTMFHVPWRCERVCICTSNGNTCGTPHACDLNFLSIDAVLAYYLA